MRRLSDPVMVAGLIAGASVVTLALAWAFQWAGYAPCELCLKGRYAHYLAIPVALVTMGAALRGNRGGAVAGFTLLIVLFVAGAAFAAYHAGVEFKLWPGPAACTATSAATEDFDVFVNQLHGTTITRCDEPALKILGLSLALWNGLICLALLALANVGLLRSAVLGRHVARLRV